MLLPVVAAAAAASADADADNADDADATDAAVAVAGRDDEEGGRCGVRLLPASPDMVRLPPLSAVFSSKALVLPTAAVANDKRCVFDEVDVADSDDDGRLLPAAAAKEDEDTGRLLFPSPTTKVAAPISCSSLPCSSSSSNANSEEKPSNEVDDIQDQIYI